MQVCKNCGTPTHHYFGRASNDYGMDGPYCEDCWLHRGNKNYMPPVKLGQWCDYPLLDYAPYFRTSQRTVPLEKEFFFLPDSEYSSIMTKSMERFDTFRKICVKFKQLGGHLVYSPPSFDTDRGAGTIFIDEDIPEENREEAADLFEGQLYQTIKLTLFQRIKP